ncbi:MAG: hypothetical protein EBY17_30155 [Acidobacteriia bacterium]|nr:hypothetical protein [Terriglobia bacterium]
MNVVPTDNPSIYSYLTTLQGNQELLALVRPNNPPPGIAGFLLDIVEDDGSELESDITDHYIEDNTAIQDHIALRPEIVTVSGRVAELVKTVVTAKPITPAQNTLPIIPELVPELTPGGQEIEDSYVEAQAQGRAAVVSDQSLYGYYQSQSKRQPGQTKQGYIYGYFYQLWKGRQLFSVETPWGFFENMAIQSLSAKQGADSKSVSEFSITFKKIRIARTISITEGLLSGRATWQQAAENHNGIVGQAPLTSAQVVQFENQIAPNLA